MAVLLSRKKGLLIILSWQAAAAADTTVVVVVVQVDLEMDPLLSHLVVTQLRLAPAALAQYNKPLQSEGVKV
jgi:hypothetical protein